MAILALVAASACEVAPTTPELDAGGVTVFEGTLRRLPEEARWSHAPFYIEGEPRCPVPEALAPLLAAPHHFVTLEASADSRYGLVLERPEGTARGSGDTVIAAYPGRGVPSSPELARACLGIAHASGPFTATIPEVAVAAGEAITVVIYNLPSDGPTFYRLTATAR